MKWIWIVLGMALIGVFLGAPIGFGLSTYDYDLKCTKCLRENQVVERKFFGFTYNRFERPISQGEDLGSIFGSPCQHVYRTGGFGRQSGGLEADGITAEGILFRGRWEALDAGFHLYKQFPNKELMKGRFE